MVIQRDWPRLVAELVGTFFFFFIGIGAVLSVQQVMGSKDGGLNNLYVALAHGVALAIAISALGYISGGHFNPAVTIGLAVARKIDPLLGVLYIVAQIIGGVLAAAALRWMLPTGIWQPVNLGTPAINSTVVDVTMAIIMEVILTFFLVTAVLFTAVDARAPKIAGFGIGLTVFVGILVGGPISGGVMNPARALCPAIVSGDFTDWYVWWIGPIIGGIIAALMWMFVFTNRGVEPSD
jgi:MIP family channel proteins